MKQKTSETEITYLTQKKKIALSEGYVFLYSEVLKQYRNFSCFLPFDKTKGVCLKKYNVRLFSAAEHLKGFIVIFGNQHQAFFMQT